MLKRYLFGAALAAAITPVALAAPITDPIGDFVGTYTGAHNADLDVVTADVIYNIPNNTFTLVATMNGAIGISPNAVYVWGINRGTGTERFVAGSPSTGAGVFFDAVVTFTRATNVTSVNLIAPAPLATPVPGATTVSGNTISTTISAALLPSRGFALGDYTYNLWPRDGRAGNTAIADFAPDASNARVTTVPAPAMAPALLALLGFALRGKRRARV